MSVTSSSSKKTYGVIVSASDEGRSHRVTFHRAGQAPQSLMRECCDYLDALQGRWYVDAISTPESVYRDVTGDSPFPYYAERQMLCKVGRLDLLRKPVSDSHEGRAEAVRAARTGRT